MTSSPVETPSDAPLPTSSNNGVPKKVKAGPEPLLLSRKEIDVLYDIFDVVRRALELLEVEYIVTGGSLLGAIRQHSILFCDDDIDIAILDPHCGGNDENGSSKRTSVYESIIVPNLQSALDQVAEEQAAKEEAAPQKYVYQIKPWEGGDRIRSKRFNNVFLDLFVLRPYPTQESFLSVIGTKKNGQAQPQSYVKGILDTIHKCVSDKAASDDEASGQTNDSCYDALFPFWQFSTRKAIELWPKEVYLAAPQSENSSQQEQKRDELFPLQRNLKFGPLKGVCGPHTPVRLLKRAFGKDCFEVYYRSISHQQSQSQPKQATTTKQQQHPTNDNANGNSKNNKALPPKVAPGGTWEASPKVPLEEEHYLPMQPLARKRRRPTMHCKSTLFEYLQTETIREASLAFKLESARQGTKLNNGNSTVSQQRPRRTVYMDGVFDLFHIGHLEAIRQCAALGDRVILGVTGDADAEGYKRRPMVPETERTAIVGALKEVDAVVCPCPLVVTKELMDQHEIDLVVHGFANDADAERQKEFFQAPMAMGKFQRIGYYRGLSTTDRIQTIRDQNEICPTKGDTVNEVANAKAENTALIQKAEQIPSSTINHLDDETLGKKAASRIPKPQWFGATLAAASNHSATIPTDPFPLNLRIAIESHIEKARVRRREALRAIKIATGDSVYDSVMAKFQIQQERLNLAANAESVAEFEREAHNELVASLLASTGFSPTTDLSNLHKEPIFEGKTAKDRLLFALTQNHRPFQESFDNFVRTVCVPRMAQALGSTRVYYQAFPCLRIVQPGEFSIGPHSDVSYGHHPCSINGYVSLTEPRTEEAAPASALFLESLPGGEDWHSLFGRGSSSSHTRLFAGAINLHWTTENLTKATRVTFDFRMIDARVFHALQDGGDLEGGQKDVFRATPGYYHVCHKSNSTGEWIREDKEFLRPDFRVGFPWTVKNWESFWKKQQAKQHTEKHKMK